MQRDALMVDLISTSLSAATRERRIAATMLANALREQGDDVLRYVEIKASPEIVEEARKLTAELGI